MFPVRLVWDSLLYHTLFKRQKPIYQNLAIREWLWNMFTHYNFSQFYDDLQCNPRWGAIKDSNNMTWLACTQQLTSLCSRLLIMTSVSTNTPVLPTPAEQWMRGGDGLSSSFILFAWRHTDWNSSMKAANLRIQKTNVKYSKISYPFSTESDAFSHALHINNWCYPWVSKKASGQMTQSIFHITSYSIGFNKCLIA